MQIQVKCLVCNEWKFIEVNGEALYQWQHGKGHIQDLMPELSADDRELMISGTCGPCFDSMFPEGGD